MITEKHMEHRLTVWADWYTRGLGSGLGYPSKNILKKLQETGGVWIKGTGRPPVLSHPQAEEIEKLVGRLAQEYRSLADSLREYYCGQGMMSQKSKTA